MRPPWSHMCAAGRPDRAFVSRASGARLQARPVASAGALAAERGWGTFQAPTARAGQLPFLVFELPLPPSVTECGIDSSSSMRVVSPSRCERQDECRSRRPRSRKGR
jgi:hypothetical protein